MKTAAKHHEIMHIIYLVLLLGITNLVGAQWVATPPPSPVPNFTSVTMITIIVIFMGGLFFIVIYSIYIRNCTNSSGSDNIAPRAGSLRSRRAGARGLDASVIETFPTFSYSAVKDHKIGKGALECAVCLYEFQDHETLRLLPKCNHVFHQECVDPWLGSHVTCPVCRADLVPKPVLVPDNTDNNGIVEDNIVERSGSRNGEVVVQVDGDEGHREPRVKRNLSFDYVNRLQKSGSMKTLGSDRFRSHSTGHTLVQPGENLERYTLRLPPQVRNEVMNRASLNRAKSCTIVLPREASSRKGYKGDENKLNPGKYYQKIEQWSNRRAKSDSRNFFTRGFSMKSPEIGIKTDQESTSEGNGSRTPVKMRSFNCLEPKAVDEVGLFSDDQLVKSLV